LFPSSPRRGGAKRRGGQVWPVGNANIGDPLRALPRETKINISPSKSAWPGEAVLVYILEHVDVDDRIEMVAISLVTSGTAPHREQT